MSACRDCMWFTKEDFDGHPRDAGSLAGDCRRHAPTVLYNVDWEEITVFPEVSEATWCGEFELASGVSVVRTEGAKP